ncbi:signal peptidase II [Peptostreptococcus equinus]|uniref:Lipoprotein signal peptidase n=1 Tax=Peptostreptococcus equinus TaxID=3003601 RepID=A0ABY7JLL1_9FIRM|nr:signal peptidase II [Peptostreptococcus sp. CBA3647]WAW14245.1 signal peptidase II [Peptostreptococcus sp. CBA3647]
MYEILIIILLIIDQASKITVKNTLENTQGMSIIDGVFHLTYVENSGAAFGMLQNMQYVFIIIALIVLIAGIYFIHKEESTKLAKISIAMIISGAIGNLVDRLRLGYVIDFFDFKIIWSYVFNFADILVVLGTILLCICLIRSGKDEV